MHEQKEQVWNYIWSGFYSEEEIIEILMEELWNTYFDYKTNADVLELKKQELQSIIQKYSAQKIEQQRFWAYDTDLDRLELAFEEMRNSSNIIALHIAGEDYDSAIENVGAIFFEDYEDGEEMDLTVGYCFYHENDAFSLLPDFENPTDSKMNTLPIYFGNIEGLEKESLEIGNRVFQILQKYGFQVQWNANGKTPIEVQNFKWQNRFREWDEEE